MQGLCGRAEEMSSLDHVDESSGALEHDAALEHPVCGRTAVAGAGATLPGVAIAKIKQGGGHVQQLAADLRSPTFCGIPAESTHLAKGPGQQAGRVCPVRERQRRTGRERPDAGT
jgi:hypothetical protein